jgi:hypothetical protein
MTKSEGGEVAFIDFCWQTKNARYSLLFCSILTNSVDSDPNLSWFGSPGSGSVLGMQIQIRIQESQINADPCG